MRRFVEKPHQTRPMPDLKELAASGARMYGDKVLYRDRKESQDTERRAITFNQFKADMDALGTALLAKGMAGKKIAVIGENRYDWILSYFAVVNGVGIIVPLDKELPQSEIRTLLNRSKAAMVIFSEKMAAAVSEAAAGLDSIEYLINMDGNVDDNNGLTIAALLAEGRTRIAAGEREYLDKVIDNQVVAAILFTSGTTGNAKGVMLSHRNITANLENTMKRVYIEERDVLLSVLPIHHIYEFTCDILSTIYKGSTLVFCDGLKYIQKNLKEDGVTLMLGVPLIFETFHKKIWTKAKLDGKDAKLRKAIKMNQTLQKFNVDLSRIFFKDIYANIGQDIKVFISGASAIDPNVIKDFRAMGINMFQGYGLTENAPIVAVNADYFSIPESVGPAFPENKIRIDEPDEDGIGEILCQGESVMLGYFEDPEETAKTIQDGWLRTGDYGYLDEQGFVYITGRKKNVIITKNGKNIFPEELEYQLNKHDCIRESLVWGKEDESSGETFIHAEIVIEQDELKGLSNEAIHSLVKAAVDQVNQSTPSYKRIRKFNLRTEEFEKTTTKKIKRHQVEKL